MAEVVGDTSTAPLYKWETGDAGSCIRFYPTFHAHASVRRSEDEMAEVGDASTCDSSSMQE